MSFHQLTTLTWPEADRFRQDGDAIGLIPTGALEQHGPHLPMIMDSVHADVLARAIAERLDTAVVVAPALAGGLSSHHVDFPGTVNLPEPVFGGVLQAYVEAMERIGIRRVAIISGHGGNFAFIGRFAAEYGGEAEIIAYDDLQRFIDVMIDAGRAVGLEPTEADAHAGVLETSVAMALFEPHLVRDFEGLTGYTAAEPGWLERLLSEGVRPISETGILGDPRGATAIAGVAVVQALVEELVHWVGESFGIDVRATTNSRVAANGERVA
jgi:creatinine amidohydrolase